MLSPHYESVFEKNSKTGDAPIWASFHHLLLGSKKPSFLIGFTFTEAVRTPTTEREETLK